MFWLAMEDHDLEEIDQVSLLTKDCGGDVEGGVEGGGSGTGGGIEIGPEIEATLARAEELLGYGPVGELLRECYAPRDGYKPTLGGAFARLMARIFEAQGLVVMDAAGRAFHSLGSKYAAVCD